MKKTLLMLFISVLFGCSKDLEPPLDNSETEQIANTKSVSDLKESKFGEPMVLGEKIQNPYSVKSLKQQRSAIVPTHYYVRFLPENKQEYGLLLKNVRFFPFPLDRKIVEGGSFYRDPDPANAGKQFSWQYAVVPVEQILPEVQYEILDELCIPENTEEQPITRGIGGSGGTVGPPGPPLHKVIVRVWDTTLNQFIPLQGLAVNVINTAVGQSLTYGVTDATGTAVMPRYFTVTKDIFYNIFWSDGKESKWFMTDGNNNQLFYNVKAVDGVTNIDIKSSSTNVVVEQLLGTIHRAAYRTYYKPNSDLLRPIHDDAIQVGYQDEYSEDYPGFYYSQEPNLFHLSSITVFGRASNGSLKPTKSIFSTTAHEFGHLNHDVNSGRRTQVLFSSERIIKESWARAVEKLLTDLEYAFYGYSSYRTETLLYRDPNEQPPGPPGMRVFVIPNSFNFQNWPFEWGHSEEGDAFFLRLPYSPLFIDLMDNENQRDYYVALGMKNNVDYMYQDYPNDNVKDFTIRELQNLLKTVNTIEELRDKVKELPNLHGNSKTAIDNLFAKVIEYWRKYHPISKGESGCTRENGGCIIYD